MSMSPCVLLLLIFAKLRRFSPVLECFMALAWSKHMSNHGSSFIIIIIFIIVPLYLQYGHFKSKGCRIAGIDQNPSEPIAFSTGEASELRKLSGELLRERRKLLAQLQQREQSCTELLSTLVLTEKIWKDLERWLVKDSWKGTEWIWMGGTSRMKMAKVWRCCTEFG